MVTDAPSNKNYVLKETSSKGLQSSASLLVSYAFKTLLVKIFDFKCTGFNKPKGAYCSFLKFLQDFNKPYRRF